MVDLETSTSMVWVTLGSRVAKEQNRTVGLGPSWVCQKLFVYRQTVMNNYDQIQNIAVASSRCRDSHILSYHHHNSLNELEVKVQI